MDKVIAGRDGGVMYKVRIQHTIHRVHVDDLKVRHEEVAGEDEKAQINYNIKHLY